VAPRNPMVRLLDPGEEKAAVLTTRQFKDLLLIAGEGFNGIRNKSIIWHSFGSALRVTEIAKLKVKDVVEVDGEIKELAKLPGSSSKNKKPRLFIQVEDAQKAALSDYLNYRIEKQLRVSGKTEYMGLQPNSPLYLAKGQKGFAFNKKRYKKADGSVEEYMVCSSMQQLISGMIKRVGAVDGSSHSGRRTFATRLSDRGIEDSLIQSLLGHGDPNMTMPYIDANKDRIKKAAGLIYPGL